MLLCFHSLHPRSAASPRALAAAARSARRTPSPPASSTVLRWCWPSRRTRRSSWEGEEGGAEAGGLRRRGRHRPQPALERRGTEAAEAATVVSKRGRRLARKMEEEQDQASSTRYLTTFTALSAWAAPSPSVWCAPSAPVPAWSAPWTTPCTKRTEGRATP